MAPTTKDNWLVLCKGSQAGLHERMSLSYDSQLAKLVTYRVLDHLQRLNSLKIGAQTKLTSISFMGPPAACMLSL